MVSKDENIVNFDDSRKKRAAKQKQQRKTDARKEKEAKAEANRVKFGRTGAQKKLDKKRQTEATDKHEQHRLTTAPSETKQTHTSTPSSGTVVQTDDPQAPNVVSFPPAKPEPNKNK